MSFLYYRALIDIVSTLQQRVSVKDEIINRVDENNQRRDAQEHEQRSRHAFYRQAVPAIGPKTLEAVKASNRVDIIEEMANEREAFYRSLTNFHTFGRVWLRLNDENNSKHKDLTHGHPSLNLLFWSALTLWPFFPSEDYGNTVTNTCLIMQNMQGG